jgi:hypothetical protein
VKVSTFSLERRILNCRDRTIGPCLDSESLIRQAGPVHNALVMTGMCLERSPQLVSLITAASLLHRVSLIQ